MNNFPYRLILVLALFEVTVNTNLLFDDNNHGILSSRIEDYSSNNVPDYQLDLPSGDSADDRDGNGAESLLKFEPAFLDFKQRPLGIPYLKKVTLFNTDKNRSIDMKSISGNTVHFHSSFFEDKHIPPLGNTSFNVVFLGRHEGTVESNLLIHTTNGNFKYKVKGATVSSLYRLRPIVGIKLPRNTTFSPLIYVYNPHIEPIQVTEIYSSGDHFHLELPTGETEGPKNMWEIPPLQSKAVIRIRFHSHTERNHTAYIRFKLNNTENILAVPIEIDVTSSVSLYTSQGFLDFGFGGTLDVQKDLNLYLQNPSNKDIQVDSIISISKSLKIKYETLTVESQSTNDNGTQVATITIDWKSAHENQEFSGKILVTYNDGQSVLEIPYYATILEGSLLFDPSAMTYFINEFPKVMKSRDLFVKNNYSSPLAITNIFLPKEAENYFYVPHFETVILKPQEEASIFTLDLKNDIRLQNLKLNSSIVLNTNVTTIEIQLLSFNGKLHVEFPYKTKDGLMDLGLIGTDVRKEIYFVINNFNTAVININKITTSLPLAEVETIHCNIGNYTDVLARNLSYTLNPCDKLELDEFAILKLTLQSTYMEGQVWGTILIETQFENLTVPVHYKVAQGSFEICPEELYFDDCFPGKTCSHPLRVHSTFNDPMIIEKIVSIPPDCRLTSDHSGHIVARSVNTLGHLFLNLAEACLDECYLGLNFIDSVGWLHTLLLPSMTSELDLRLVTVLYNRFLNQTVKGLQKWHNLILKLDTSEVKWHIFDAHFAMIWPSLILTERTLNFPLTQIGSISYFNITLNNPSDCNLVLHIVLSGTYPDYEKLNDGLDYNFFPPNMSYDKVSPKNSAFFFNEKLYAYRGLFKTQTGLDTHEATLPVLLLPGDNFTFSLGFDSDEPGSHSAFLYIRNNLTVVELIHVSGRSVVPNFRFGNRKSGSDSPLLFELTDKQFKECETKRRVVPNFSVKRSFTARNLGDITITIRGFYINELLCEGYGFKVLNCEHFELPPNSSRKIDIGFMPDFTVTNIVRTLILDTNLNQQVSYTLLATIPVMYLYPCAASINRPVWEPHLYYISLGLMGVLLIFVIGMVIGDAEHLLKASVDAATKANATVEPPLDLRQVGIQTRIDIHSNQTVKEEPLQKPTTLIQPIIDSPSVIITSKESNLETDKYSVLIPTTGKSKKKLMEGEIDDSKEKRKKSWLEARKLKNKNNSKDIKRAAYLNNKECKKENKKHGLKKYEPEEEEETYSVSTDSSNNEEIDKISGCKTHILLKKCTKLQRINDTEEHKSEQTYYKDIKKCKPMHKAKNKEKLESKDDDLNHKTIKNNPSKDYVERQNLKKKLSLEKKSWDKNLTVQVNPTHFTVWGENKASFSDVVARNDISPVNFAQHVVPSISKLEQQSTPIETYTTSTDLGPIGSRKTEHLKEQSLNLSNSFGNNNFRLENSSNAWDLFLQPTSVPPKKDNHGHEPNTLVSGIWENISQSTQSTTNLSVPSSSLEVGSYLWGSSPVWAPWQPSDIPKTCTRSPPGFENNSGSEVPRNWTRDRNYDLFGMSNIWSRHYPNPWNSNPENQ